MAVVVVGGAVGSHRLEHLAAEGVEVCAATRDPGEAKLVEGVAEMACLLGPDADFARETPAAWRA